LNHYQALRLSEKMQRRRKFDYTHWDFLYASLCPFKAKLVCWRKDGNSVHDHYLQYSKGEDKINDDFEIASFITNIRQVKTLNKLLLNSQRQNLEKYSKYHLIEHSEGTEDGIKEIIIPSMKQKNGQRDIHLHNSHINEICSIQKSIPLKNDDRLLINQIWSKILNEEKKWSNSNLSKIQESNFKEASLTNWHHWEASNWNTNQQKFQSNAPLNNYSTESLRCENKYTQNQNLQEV
jgi:hypothetical protein